MTRARPLPIWDLDGNAGLSFNVTYRTTMGKPNDLDNIRLRLDHADKAIEILATQVQEYFQSAAPLNGRYEAESSDYVFELTGPRPPGFLGLLLGDALHALRATLDNLVWRAVVRNGQEPGGQTQYPVVAVDNSKGRDEFKKRTSGASDTDRAIITEFQPFQDHDDLHMLLTLVKYSNWDKHRVIVPSVATAQTLRRHTRVHWTPLDLKDPDFLGQISRNPNGHRWKIAVPQVEGADRVTWSTGGGSGRELVRIKLANVTPELKVTLSNDLYADVVFGDEEDQLSVPRLRDVVARILDRFDQHWASA